MATALYAARRVRRALTRRAAQGEAPPESELNIVPFLDIVTNLLLFLLATTSSVMMVAQVDAQLPSTRRGARGEPPTLRVTLAGSGIVVSGPGGYAAPGCDRTARAFATAVPRNARGGYDFAALSTCMERAREALPVGDQVILTADPTVPYDDVLHAMDAVRARGDRALFPDVLISAGVR